MPSAEVTLPANVSSVPTARHFVESILAGWGLTELGWTATLVVSELAANAALHARGDHFSVSVSTNGDGIRLELHDTSVRLPQQRSYSREATTGRGLRLVSDLAHEWGVQPTADGKIVWALLRTDTGSSGDDLDDAGIDALLDAFSDEVGGIPDGPDRPRARTSRLCPAA